jgi:hypothetical protein
MRSVRASPQRRNPLAIVSFIKAAAAISIHSRLEQRADDAFSWLAIDRRQAQISHNKRPL